VPQSQLGHFGEEKKFLPMPGIETLFLGCPVHSLVTTINIMQMLISSVDVFKENSHVLW